MESSGGGTIPTRPRSVVADSQPPRKGGDREEQGEEEDEEDAGEGRAREPGDSKGKQDWYEDECRGDDPPGARCLFFLPRFGGRVNAGGFDFLRGFLGLGSEAILL